MPVNQYRSISGERISEVASFDKLPAVVKEDPTFGGLDRLVMNDNKIVTDRCGDSIDLSFGQDFRVRK